MVRRKRTGEAGQELQSQIDRSVRKRTQKKHDNSPFLLSRTSYQNFNDDEKKQADTYIEKGEWVVISTKDDLAHDFLIYMLLRDCVKSGYFKNFLEIFVEGYRRERPQNYENLIKRIVSILEDNHLSREDIEIIIRSYQERLSNA